VRHLIDRGMRIAKSANGPSVLILPKDIQNQDYYNEPEVAHGFTRSGIGYHRPRIVPQQSDLTRAAEVLNAGSKVAVLIGSGARSAAPQIIEVAEVLGLTIYLSSRAPSAYGVRSWDLIQGCDTLCWSERDFHDPNFLPASFTFIVYFRHFHEIRSVGIASEFMASPATKEDREEKAACLCGQAAQLAGLGEEGILLLVKLLASQCSAEDANWLKLRPIVSFSGWSRTENELPIQPVTAPNSRFCDPKWNKFSFEN
jgi:hypothetical protein